MEPKVTAQDVVDRMVGQYRKRIANAAFLSSGQVAEALMVSEATVKRWSDDGVIACIRSPGGHRKYTAANVADYLNSEHNIAHGGGRIPYTVVGVDPASKDGDACVETTMRRNGDGTVTVTGMKVLPTMPTAAISEDSASELDG